MYGATMLHILKNMILPNNYLYVLANNSGVCSEPCSSLIRHLRLFTMHLRKMLDFSVLLSKGLFAFAFVVFWLNYDLHVVFYV